MVEALREKSDTKKKKNTSHFTCLLRTGGTKNPKYLCILYGELCQLSHISSGSPNTPYFDLLRHPK